MNFTPIYKESHTDRGDKCSYCGRHIFLRYINEHSNSYKLNGKYICWDCLVKYAHMYDVSVTELRGKINGNV